MAGRTRRWVYEHAGVLGAVPLGGGERPRLGFHPARVREYLSRDWASLSRARRRNTRPHASETAL
jgi:hypothetical protein